jgi:transposase
MALEGRFTGHHALMCRLHLDRITALDAAVADLEARIAATAADWQREIDLLKTIPGFGDIVAWAWIAEIGPAPHQWFASHHKLASWVSLARAATSAPASASTAAPATPAPTSSRC